MRFIASDSHRRDRLLRHAFALSTPRLLFDEQPRSERLTIWDRFQLARAAAILRRLQLLEKMDFRLPLLLGKIHQRLGNHRKSMELFLNALRLAPRETAICKDAAVAAMELGDLDRSIAILKEAVAVRQDDAVLHYNLALALLLAGEAEQARDSVMTSARLQARSMTEWLMALTEEVLAGRRSCPKTLAEVRRFG